MTTKVKKTRKRRRRIYSDESVKTALACIIEGGSQADAAREVQAATGQRPDAHTVSSWVKSNAEAFAALKPEKRREWELLAGEVYQAWAARALEAAEARKSDGSYAVSHSQCMIPYGIAKDGLARVLDAIGDKTVPAVAIQFNLRTSTGEPLGDV